MPAVIVRRYRKKPSLRAPVVESEWLYLVGFQGTVSDLSVGVSSRKGQLVALAQWTRQAGSDTKYGIAACETREGIARLLTFAKVAVERGRA